MSDPIGSKQRDVASISVMLSLFSFKTERIPSNPHVQKEPHFLHEWGKADFSNITKSCFTSPSALGVVYRAVTTDRVAERLYWGFGSASRL